MGGGLVIVKEPVSRGSPCKVFSLPIKFIHSDELIGTPVQGLLEYDGTRLYFTNVGTRRVLSRASSSITSSVSIVNTTDETTLFLTTLSANILESGKVYRISGFGSYSTASASDTVTINIKIAGNIVGTITTTAGVVNSEPMYFWFVFTSRSTGSSGIISLYTYLKMGSKVEHINTSIITINTIIPNEITITGQWDTAKTNNILIIDQAFLEAIC